MTYFPPKAGEPNFINAMPTFGIARIVTRIIAGIVLTCISTGCITGIDIAPAATPKSPTREASLLPAATVGLIHRQVRNAEYVSSFISVGRLRLSEGRFIDNGVAGKSKTVVDIDPQIALGDFTRDGFEDAAAVLTTRVDSKTTLFELHALRYLNGQATHMAAYLLGNNLVIHELKIQPGLIIVVTRAPSPLSTQKSPLEIETIRTFRVEKNRLIEVLT